MPKQEVIEVDDDFIGAFANTILLADDPTVLELCSDSVIALVLSALADEASPSSSSSDPNARDRAAHLVAAIVRDFDVFIQ